MSDKIKQFRKDCIEQEETSLEEMRERADEDLNWEGVSWGLEWLEIDFVREFKDRFKWDWVPKWDGVDKKIIKEFLHDIEKSMKRETFEEYVLTALNKKDSK